MVLGLLALVLVAMGASASSTDAAGSAGAKVGSVVVKPEFGETVTRDCPVCCTWESPEGEWGVRLDCLPLSRS